jgi:hypothetical protein
MKSILDPSFDYTPSVDTDIRRTFERVWRELGVREDADGDLDAERSSFWLECNGELVDAASVAIVGTRTSALGIEMAEFVCPRCKKLHESLTFR